jgi:hypothetical protein
MPPNLALTDSDIEGDEYDSPTHNSHIYLHVIDNKGYVDKVHLNNCYVGVNIMGDYGAYTELAGINWDYTGPLQGLPSTSGLTLEWPLKNKKITNFYKPGGHFLGITCRNSETTMKTCVNLSRICEHGVWMSQRKEIHAPKDTYTNGSVDDNFHSYATVPSGFISKDEISDTNYRRIFASMNKNKLRTIINKENDFPIYDFHYVNPTNFGGELSDYVFTEKYDFGGTKRDLMNRVVTTFVKEHDIEYTDDNFYKPSVESSVVVNEKQIMRTGEYLDNEYYKFRFGLNSLDSNYVKRRFLIDEGSSTKVYKIKSGYVSFPIYDNSFYFYFGLHDGKTALDDFKREYYSVCSKSNDLSQNDLSISLIDLSVSYDGVHSDAENGSGSISFKIKMNKEYIGENGVNVTLKNYNGELIERKEQITNIDDTIYFNGLKYGKYDVQVITNGEVSMDRTFNVEVKQITLTSEINAVNFITDVSEYEDNESGYKEIFTLERPENGGYLYFASNNFKYDDEFGAHTKDVFSDNSICSIILKNEINSITVKNKTSSLITFEYLDVDVNASMNGNKEYLIPVPKEDISYSVYIETYMDSNGKLANTVTNKTHRWYIGDVNIKNVIKLDVRYNDVSYSETIKQYLTGQEGYNSKQGWWSNEEMWKNDSLETLWKIKENLYFGSNSHNINISYNGGTPPYVELIKSVDGDGNEYTCERSELKDIKRASINYENGIKNFNYKVIDMNGEGQKSPKKDFYLPVIYKPFFMEICLMKFDGNKYYMGGNVYNGITWDYVNSGFNDVLLNDVKVPSFNNITEPDYTMKIVEPTLSVTSGGGYDYNGPYYKYNGRKYSVSREIDAKTYGMEVDYKINPITLSIGSSNKVNEITYSNSTYIKANGNKFTNFSLNSVTKDGKYYIKMTTTDTDFSLYPLFEGDYTHPIVNGSFSLNDKLYRHLMGGNLISANLNYESVNGISGYINVSDNSLIGKKLYYVALPNISEADKNGIETSNSENKLICVSVSEIINVGVLSKFYPLNIKCTGRDVYHTLDDYFITTLTVTPMIGSENNFKNKTFEFNFYKLVNNSKIQTKTVTFNTYENDSISVDITSVRYDLGIDFNKLTQEETMKTLYFDYIVYSEEGKSPTPYVNNNVGIVFYKE